MEKKYLSSFFYVDKINTSQVGTSHDVLTLSKGVKAIIAPPRYTSHTTTAQRMNE